MLNPKKIIALSVFVIVGVVFQAVVAYAALVPSFFLAQGSNTSQTQVTVLGADANASVILYYPQGGTYSSFTLGTTDSTGRLSSTINPATYNITPGGVGYVIVNGAQSQTQVWPAYTAANTTSSTGLSLSQNTLSIIAGQSTAVSASANSGTLGSLSIASNSNPSSASASISGNQVIVNALATGSTIITVCSTTAGCSTMNVLVQQQTTSSNTSTNTGSQAISFSPSTLTMKKGESRIVALSGSGSYYISAHSLAGVVSTSISGSNLTLVGQIIGTDTMSVCSSGSNTTSCGALNVTVVAADTTTSTTGSTATISFSPSSMDLTIGQTKTVVVTGSGLGSYYISNNSSSETASANLSGSSISVIGNKAGGTNITVCQLGAQCGSFYVFVPVGGGTSAASTVTSGTNVPLALSSFSVSSNNVNNKFLGASVALTITFSLNQSVSSPLVTIGNSGVPVFGSGSGPYTVIYNMNGSEQVPLSVDISFGNSTAGNSSAHFAIGGSSGSSASGSSGSSTSGAQVSNVFTVYLESGSTGAQVTALQTRLKALGIYSGPITGTFGAQTEAAVKKYQAKHKINQLGAVGPATRALLNQGI